MLFNEQTCKRVQTGSAKINWVHSVLKLNEFHLSQCFFGDHLLVDESKVVAIVESEKTAVIASIYFPQFIWLAVGGVQNLNWNRLKFLSERNVHVFPDLGVYTKWKNKIESFSFLANFRINNFLELHATAEEKADGLDLADYLLKFDLKEFRNDNSKRDNTQSLKNDVIQPIQFPEKEDDLIGAVDAITGECWDGSYDELELYFSMLKCDIEILHLDKCTTIMDFSKFVKSHLLILKEHWNKRVFRPFLDRLLMVKLHLKDDQL
jgi:hypothetical protein